MVSQYERLFLNLLNGEGSQNNIKMLRGRFQKCLGTCAMLVVEASSETRLFRHLSNHVFAVRNLRNTKAMRVMFFFENIQDLIQISKMSPEIQKKCFVFDIIASEFVSLNCLY